MPESLAPPDLFRRPVPFFIADEFFLFPPFGLKGENALLSNSARPGFLFSPASFLP